MNVCVHVCAQVCHAPWQILPCDIAYIDYVLNVKSTQQILVLCGGNATEVHRIINLHPWA